MTQRDVDSGRAMTDASGQVSNTSGAEAFETYIVGQLREMGLDVTRHATRAAKLVFGDVRIVRAGRTSDLKIHFDTELNDSGDLWIPVDDMRDPCDLRVVPAGIMSSATFKWFGIGDYRFWWLFDRGVLQREAKRHAIERHASQRWHGFTLPRARATDIARKVFFWDDRYADGRCVEPVDPMALLRSIGEAAFGIKYDT